MSAHLLKGRQRWNQKINPNVYHQFLTDRRRLICLCWNSALILLVLSFVETKRSRCTQIVPKICKFTASQPGSANFYVLTPKKRSSTVRAAGTFVKQAKGCVDPVCTTVPRALTRRDAHIRRCTFTWCNSVLRFAVDAASQASALL